MAFSPAPLAVPAPEEVTAIRSLSDPVIRNLQITACYCRLSAAMSARIGQCANWCTFATWASRQAGRTIRGEDMLDRLTRHTRAAATFHKPLNRVWRRVLRHGILQPESFAGRIVRRIHSPFDAIELASDAVARGNRKVFEEIGFEFARYLQSGSDFDEFLAGLRSGPPPEGQDLLKSAFRRYHFRSDEPQQVLLANIEIGLHEQTRLQPEIREALEAVPEMKERLSRLTVFLTPGYREFVRDVIRRVITESLMVLEIPGTVLSLGRRLEAVVPEKLRRLDDAELLALLRRYEPHEGECTDCGAEDWAELSQRMHYILNLFRAYHFECSLFQPPFPADQLREITEGRLPYGKL